MTVSFPVGLGLGSNPGSITVNGLGNRIISESPLQPLKFEQKPEGLSVQSGETLALIGNGINFNGVVNIEGGEIYINSLNSGSVSINQIGGDINVDISDSIQLATSSIITTTFAEGNAGNIHLSASQLRLNAAGVTSSTNGSGNGGTLNVDAALIEIAGTASRDRASIATTSFATGDAGNLTLNTEQLRVIDGASLSSSSFATGDAGTLAINASKSVEVKGASNNPIISTNPQSTIRSAVQSVSSQAAKALGLPKIPTGNAGNLTIITPQLNVLQKGVVSVENQGTGDAGTLC